MTGEFARNHRVVNITEVKVNVLYLIGYGLGKDKQLGQGHDKNYRQHHAVAKYLQKLFPHYVENLSHIVADI